MTALAFLSPTAPGAPPARSPMERDARAAGARFEVRGGWNVAVAYERAGGDGGGWADVSHLRKLELQGPAEALERAAGVPLQPAAAAAAGGATWCPLTRERVLLLGGEGELRTDAQVSVVDVTTTFAALTVLGPSAREALARLTALDLRPAVTPPGAFRPGSVARVPAMVLCEAPERFLVLFGAALGHYVWTAVADAAERLGGAPVGADALEAARA